jgi:adenine-specific DNA-methyltransferase
LGFVCDGRYLFSQKSLENVPLPATFDQFRVQGMP